MNGAAWLLALATLGVDYGWQLDKDGQLEYIIQIPPTQLETLRDRPEGISSSIPPEVVRHVKRFRIVVGSEPLPKEPLPTFPAEGNVTPINVDASRVNPAGADLPLTGDESSGFETPTLESTVTPLDDMGVARTDLPGPAPEIPGDPADAVDSILPMPPIPRADDRGFDFGSLAAVTPRAVIRQGQLDPDLRPNVSAPDVSDAWNSGAADTFDDRRGSYSDTGELEAADRRTQPRRNANGTFPTSNNFNTLPEKERIAGPLAATILALFFSIGGNVYLGWVAWGYYMKYRETFESWRGWTSSH